MSRLDDDRTVAAGRDLATGRPPAGPVVEVGGLDVAYGDFPAVTDLSFRVERGELYALLGTNGAGKTSVLEVIEGHRRASAGDVRVFGSSSRCRPMPRTMQLFDWEPRR